MRSQSLEPIVAESPAMKHAVELGRCFATGKLPILLLAPTGCGKELLAQHIHQWSGRRGSPVDINCAALPESLVESELFGHDDQGYTGARRAKRGLMEEANAGTLFLDEVSSLPLVVQGKLLRVLDTEEVRRIGELEKRSVNVRFIAAAQDDLADRVVSGTFRRDLYQRLAGVVITIPPLAERQDDVIPLARQFAALHGQTLEAEAEALLVQYGWPGNVRELRQVIERAGRLVQNGTQSAGAVAEAIALGAPLARSPSTFLTTFRLRRITPEQLRSACEANNWRAGPTAAALGVGRTTLFKLLRDCGLSLRRPRVEFARPPVN